MSETLFTPPASNTEANVLDGEARIAKKIFVEGHGCSASFADTEILSGLIASAGYHITRDENEADLCVLVTCSVKTVTEQRMLSRIRQLRDNGSGKLVVAGCLPKANSQKLLSLNQNLSLIGPSNLESILPAVEATLSGRRFVNLQPVRTAKLGLPRTRKNKVIGVVEIASGCLSSCTFCQVKLIKGTVFSYPEDRILDEVRALLSDDAKEIWLTSTDCACYGRDTHTSLPDLVKRVADIPGEFMIRVGMMNPLVTERLLDGLIDCFTLPKVFKFLHLPVQTGSDRILALMQRGYSVQDFVNMVTHFRQKIPRLTLSTDVIVGFPTETEVDFLDTMKLMREVKPDVVNLSRFGARDGTKAASMDGQVHSDVSKWRSAEMTMLVRQISKEKNESWVGWEGPILLDEFAENSLVGRNFAYKSCVIPIRSYTDVNAQNRQASSLGEEIGFKAVRATTSALQGVAMH